MSNYNNVCIIVPCLGQSKRISQILSPIRHSATSWKYIRSLWRYNDVEPMREKCPNMKLFLVRTEYRKIQTRNNSVFAYLLRNGTWPKSDEITKQLSVLLVMKHNNFLSAKTSGRCLEEVFMTSWKRKSCYTEGVFNMFSSRRIPAGL